MNLQSFWIQFNITFTRTIKRTIESFHFTNFSCVVYFFELPRRFTVTNWKSTSISWNIKWDDKTFRWENFHKELSLVTFTIFRNVLSPKVRINTLTNLPRLSKINHKIDILNSSKSRLASNISSKLKTLSFLSVTKLLKSASFYFSYGTIHLESIVIYFREKALSPLSFSDNFTRVIPG